MDKVLYSSRSDNWSTPDDLFFQLDNIFHFNLDPCSDDFNYKCDLHYTKKDDGLSKSWKDHIVFCNPPYGRDIYKWVEKAYFESFDDNTLVVMLLPARTDTRWFHEFCLKYSRIYFIKGRIKFSNKGRAPFPSMICIFDNFYFHDYFENIRVLLNEV